MKYCLVYTSALYTQRNPLSQLFSICQVCCQYQRGMAVSGSVGLATCHPASGFLPTTLSGLPPPPPPPSRGLCLAGWSPAHISHTHLPCLWILKISFKPLQRFKVEFHPSQLSLQDSHPEWQPLKKVKRCQYTYFLSEIHLCLFRTWL